MAAARAGAELAVIRGGEIAERIAIGADPQTLFQAASISKVVTSVTVMRLVEQGRIGLDTPVNEMLRSWTLPGPGAERVTPRLLLSHRGGTTVAGFPGYAVGAPLPTLAEILDGTPPANTRGVRVAWPPGEAFRYSGGGTMVLQRLVMDVAAQDFDALARELVLAPADMSRSGFFQPLPASESNGHRRTISTATLCRTAITSIPSMPRQDCGARRPIWRSWRWRSARAGGPAGC